MAKLQSCNIRIYIYTHFLLLSFPFQNYLFIITKPVTSFDGKYVLADQPSQKTQSNLVLMGAENPRTVLLSLQLRAVKMLYG